MRGLVVTSATLGVLAAGVVPALLLAGGQDSTSTSVGATAAAARPAAAAGVAAEDDVRERPPAWAPGPPPWARGWACGPHKTHADRKAETKPGTAEKDEGKGRPWRCDDTSADRTASPPGWVHRPGDGHGRPGNGHGAQMRTWAHCVGAKARAAGDRGEESFDPEAVCGARPEPPGRSREHPTDEPDD